MLLLVSAGAGDAWAPPSVSGDDGSVASDRVEECRGQGPGHNYLIPPELEPSEVRCGEPSHAGRGREEGRTVSRISDSVPMSYALCLVTIDKEDKLKTTK